MKNRLEIRGDVAVVFLERKDGAVYECLVDTEDLGKIKNFRWHLGTKHYVRSHTSRVGSGKQRGVLMHRLILKPLPNIEVDHINHNPLDNRKCNLRLATVAENQQNRTGLCRHNTSGYHGVNWDARAKKWEARVQVEGKRVRVGLFDDPSTAHSAITLYRKNHIPFSKEGTQESLAA